MPDEDLKARARRIRLVLMDVDGVLTDGRIWYAPGGAGMEEVKAFDVGDGAGIVLARKAGLATGIISGRDAAIVVHRARELGIDEVHVGVRDKAAVLETVLAARSLRPEEAAFIGDEVVDLPVMRRVGLPIAVANASEDVKPYAVYVTAAEGGRGAVREAVELILKAQDRWDMLLAEFLS